MGNFGVPFGLQKFLQIPDKDFLVDYEEEEGDTRGVEYFDVVRNLAPNIG